MLTTLLEAIASRRALVGVVGLGYVGLPLARLFIDAGFRVLGFDTDAAKIAKLGRGESYVGDVPSHWVAEAVGQGRLAATGDAGRLGEPDAVLICVPTPLTADREPDLSFVEATTRQIAAVLRPGQLVVLESTTWPGTTRQVVLPLLAKSRLEAGSEFFLAYSPERQDPGNRRFPPREIPKVVAGIDTPSLEAVQALYQQVVAETVPVSSCEAAEASKILENTYRAVNIDLVNEVKVLHTEMRVEVWEVIAAAATKPFGFQAFSPGPGLGGHCIPIDPFYLSWLAKQHGLAARLVETAGEINTEMPRFVLERTAQALAAAGKSLAGSRVLLLGVAYKRDVDDPRESPAFELLELLLEAGAAPGYHDPFIPRLPSMRNWRLPPLESLPLTPETLAENDAVIVVTDHTALDYAFVVRHARCVIDTRNATAAVREGREKIWSA